MTDFLLYCTLSFGTFIGGLLLWDLVVWSYHFVISLF